METRTPPLLPPTSLPEPLLHLLGTNDPPSCQDTVVIAEWTRLCDDFLAQSDAARLSSDADSSLVEQREQRATVQRLREQLQLAISPLRRLPPEILQEIFFDGGEPLRVFNDDDSHYVVGQVCRKWRAISHNFPRMWSRLEIFVPAAPLSAPILVRTLIDRARNVPLQFNLTKFTFDADCSEMMGSLLALLVEYSLRWERAEFSGLTIQEVHFLSAVRGRVPQLRFSSIDIERHKWDMPRKGIIRAIEIAPRLIDLRLCNLPLGHVLLDATVDKQITSFAVKDFDDFDGSNDGAEPIYCYDSLSLLDTLRKFPNLTFVEVSRVMSFEVWKGPPTNGTPRHMYPSLTCMITTELDSLYRLLLPNLTALHVGLEVDHDVDFYLPLLPCTIDLVRRSHCRLSTISLKNGALEYTSVCELFTLTPVLENLSISYGQCADANGMLHGVTRALGALDMEGEDVFEVRFRYIPGLRTLSISAAMPEWTFIDRAFLDMVSGRLGKDELQSVMLCCFLPAEQREERFPSLTKRDEMRLRDMKEEGVVEVCVAMAWL